MYIPKSKALCRFTLLDTEGPSNEATQQQAAVSGQYDHEQLNAVFAHCRSVETDSHTSSGAFKGVIELTSASLKSIPLVYHSQSLPSAPPSKSKYVHGIYTAQQLLLYVLPIGVQLPRPLLKLKLR